MIIRDPARFKDYILKCRRKAYLVPVATACNARCYFCATDVYSPKSDTELMASGDVASTVAALVEHGVERFEITGGGEPTLFTQLPELVSDIRRASADSIIKLYTNGAKLRRVAVVDEVNVSRVAWDPIKNQEVMRIRGGSPDLAVVSPVLRELGIPRLRLSVPIVAGYVDSVSAVLELAGLAQDHFDAIVLRPLYPATPNRDLLHDGKPANWWSDAVDGLELDVELEVDEIGCFRSHQLIVGSDLCAYSNWSLDEFAPGTQ